MIIRIQSKPIFSRLMPKNKADLLYSTIWTKFAEYKFKHNCAYNILPVEQKDKMYFFDLVFSSEMEFEEAKKILEKEKTLIGLIGLEVVFF